MLCSGTSRWPILPLARATSGGATRPTCCPPSSPRWTSWSPSRSRPRSGPRWRSATPATQIPVTSGRRSAGSAPDASGRTIKPEWFFPTPDVMTGIAEILQAVPPDGSGVVINPPVYGPFYLRLGYMNREVVDAPLHRAGDGSYDLDFEVLDQALARPDVSAYLLCSPHNPLGNVWRRDQLLTIADLAARHQVVLLVDEIHAPLALADARHVPFASLDHPMAQRAYTFNSASKGWNIAGLKCGIAVASSQAMADLLTDRWEALLASHFGVLASIAAF